jgi:tartrate-resistant acid phosphatase type 5
MITRRSFIASTASATLPLVAGAQNEPTAADKESLHFIAIGDWGPPMADQVQRKAQQHVANKAAAYLNSLNAKPAALLALGDNFYVDALTGLDDPRWRWSLEDLYPASTWACPIPFLAGNHDYEDHGNLRLEVAYARQQPAPRWFWGAQGNETWYSRSFSSGGQPLVTFLMLDTNTDHLQAPDGKAWKAQMEWLNHQMDSVAAAKVPWVIPVAHHPMWSAGFHYDESGHHDPRDPHMYDILRGGLLPKLAKCPLYISGHDHNLQHITHPQHPGMDFLISGGGGGEALNARHKLATPGKIPFTSDFHQQFGFLHLKISLNSITWRLVGLNDARPLGYEVCAEGTKTSA